MAKKTTPAAGPRRERQVTTDLVRAALASIPPDALTHDDRVRIAFAVHDGIGDAGRDLFLDWAGSRSEPDPRGDLATWKSARKPGQVKVGTLFGVAKDHGFRFAEDGQAAPVPDPAELERQRAERERRQAETEAEYRARADGAAIAARRMWQQAGETGTSPYLKRKGVGAYGVRFRGDGTLLVPMSTAAGEIMNLQLIAPAKPEDGPEKRYLHGGRKKGLLHWTASPDGAPVLLLCEGYATGATLFEATGRPVAVCFDAGNLVDVAKALRPLYPAALLLVCGDDDRETEQRTGTNPGREKAATAARAAAEGGAPAGAVWPEGLPTGGTDFNDLAAAAGLQAVQDQVERAVAQPTVPKPRRPASSGRGGAAGGRDRAEHQPPPDDVVEGRPEPDRWGFFVDRRGVWHAKRDRDGELSRPTWLCAPLRVTARTRTEEAAGWGYLLEFADADRNPKSWAMPSALLASDGAEWPARLRDMGLEMGVGSGVRNLIGTYINTRHPKERVVCTERVGWHGKVYVLPSDCIGQSGPTRYVFQSDGVVEDRFKRSGTLAQWRDQVAALCAKNSRHTLSVCLAFAGPLLRFSGLEGGIVHFRGDSRSGKSTALRAAASVYGRPGAPGYWDTWRTTANAIESKAVAHNDGALVLDELGVLEAREMGDSVYLLANGVDKSRATRTLLPRRQRTWLLLVVSTGEAGMHDLMGEVGKRPRPGQEVRMCEVPFDAGAGMGGFEELHGFESPPELSEAITARALRHYGTAGRAWLQWCAQHFDELERRVPELIDRYRMQMVPEASSGQVRTVGSRFALAAAAGELATEAGITGWQPGQAAWAARQCFEAWLAARGHVDNGEDAAMVRQVRAYLEKYGEANFTWHHRAMDDHKPNTPMRAGFRRLVDAQAEPMNGREAEDYLDAKRKAGEVHQAVVQFLVLPQAFKNDVCRGHDPDAVARLLQRRGHLRGEKDRLQSRQRLPGMGEGKSPCYLILPSIFSDEY